MAAANQQQPYDSEKDRVAFAMFQRAYDELNADERRCVQVLPGLTCPDLTALSSTVLPGLTALLHCCTAVQRSSAVQCVQCSAAQCAVRCCAVRAVRCHRPHCPRTRTSSTCRSLLPRSYMCDAILHSDATPGR